MCENVQPKREWKAFFGGVESGYHTVIASTEELATKTLIATYGKDAIFGDVSRGGALVMHDMGPAVCCITPCDTPPSFIDGTGNLYCCKHALEQQEAIDAQLPSPTQEWCNNDPCEAPATHKYWNGQRWVYLCTPCKQAFEWGQSNSHASVEVRNDEVLGDAHDDEEWRAGKREEMGLDDKYPWLLEEDDGSLDESTKWKVCDVPA